MSFENWTDGLTEICSGFQLELSCLLDGELEQAAAARAMLHLEECRGCREFFEDTRRQVRLHRDMADPERLLARVAALTGNDLASASEGFDLSDRLATIFYQLGKAYALAAMEPDRLREFVFEAAVPVDSAKDRGRGFVDGIVLGGKGQASNVDWRHARQLLNGRLERIQDPLEKGRKLLLEVLEIDAAHEEARHYLALIHKHEGKSLQAAEAFRDLFETALVLENRAHAAINLGRLHFAEEDRRRALVLWRWVLACGVDRGDDRFWFVRFNIAMAYAWEGDPARSIDYFRRLLDTFPERAPAVGRALAASPNLQMRIEAQEGFAEALLERCPELFQNSHEGDDLA